MVDIGDELLHVVLLRAREPLDDGGERYMTCVELWSLRIVIRWTRPGAPDPHSPSGWGPPREQDPFGWNISDDVDTTYSFSSGGASSGDGTSFDCNHIVRPGAPATAQRLTIRSPT